MREASTNLLRNMAFTLLSASLEQESIEEVKEVWGRLPLWIPVTDSDSVAAEDFPTPSLCRLDPMNKLLVAVKGCTTPLIGHYCLKDGKWYDWELEIPFSREVTHWMPLPKAPKPEVE